MQMGGFQLTVVTSENQRNGKTRASESRLVLVLFKVKKLAQVFEPISFRSKYKTNYFSKFKLNSLQKKTYLLSSKEKSKTDF